MVVLKEKNFVLRPFKKGDEISLTKNANNKKIWINLLDKFPYPYTLKDAKKWIKDCNKNENKKTRFAITIDNKVVGGITFRVLDLNSKKTAEMGYWLGENYWGKGIMSEAVKLVLDYVFNNFDIIRMQAYVFEYNPGSCKVLEKNGFILEGRLRKNIFKDGKIVDEFLYAKIR